MKKNAQSTYQNIRAAAGHPLLKRLHYRLTLLFTAAAGLILLVMSICYIYLSEREWKETTYLSFLNESGSILSNFEHQDTITFRQLTNAAYQNQFLIAIYDNGILLSYSACVLNTAEKKLAESALANAKKLFSQTTISSMDYSSTYMDFIQKDSENNTYYANAAQITNSSSTLHAIILFPTKEANRKLHSQRLRFLLINALAILLLFIFAYYYTGWLLIPIEENQKKQNTFLAAVSHELRTPLAVILSSMSAFETADIEEQRQLVHAVTLESKRMSTLINDMLLLVRANNRHLSLSGETVSMKKFCLQNCELDTLVLNSYEAFLPMAHQKEITFQIVLPENAIPPCICDSDRIMQVIAVLLSNAFSYGKPGGKVTLSLSWNPDDFRISVEDNGTGIPDDVKGHIFEPFFRNDASRTGKEHFGLGLCIAKEIVSYHHGQITVTDTTGGGAAFTVVLPSSQEV